MQLLALQEGVQVEEQVLQVLGLPIVGYHYCCVVPGPAVGWLVLASQLHQWVLFHHLLHCQVLWDHHLQGAT